jgi:hypothetical protein
MVMVNGEKSRKQLEEMLDVDMITSSFLEMSKSCKEE